MKKFRLGEIRGKQLNFSDIPMTWFWVWAGYLARGYEMHHICPNVTEQIGNRVRTWMWVAQLQGSLSCLLRQGGATLLCPWALFCEAPVATGRRAGHRLTIRLIVPKLDPLWVSMVRYQWKNTTQPHSTGAVHPFNMMLQKCVHGCEEFKNYTVLQWQKSVDR